MSSKVEKRLGCSRNLDVLLARREREVQEVRGLLRQLRAHIGSGRGKVRLAVRWCDLILVLLKQVRRRHGSEAIYVVDDVDREIGRLITYIHSLADELTTV